MPIDSRNLSRLQRDSLQVKVPTGTFDILPNDIPRWRNLEEITHRVCALYGYSEIRTPLFEYTSLFNRSVGATTDIVEKEMYTFRQTPNPKSQIPNAEAESEESISLRPEMTASVVRAYLEHHMEKEKKFQKFYYLGPFFRHERPQKGRYRQFHQIGVEAIGSYDALLDVEIILLSLDIIKTAGVKKSSLVINSLGCPKCVADYRKRLKTQLLKSKPVLCANCQSRLERNVLRVLDCKNPECYKITSHLPAIMDSLCPECQTHFNQVTEGLKQARIDYEIERHLVRGIDYYTRTIFEIRHASLGSQDALGGGGRYDNLVEELGGPPTGATGFALGMERILLASSKAQELKSSKEAGLKVFIVTVDEPASPVGGSARGEAFILLTNLRRQGVSADMDYEGRSLKAQFRQADKLRAQYTIIIGPDELKRGMVKLKEMASGKEEEIYQKDIITRLAFPPAG